jgi:WD40 repeat protein
MGVVYLAEQRQPVRRRIAIKVIKLGMDTKEVIARFESERQALAMMTHPNIAKVLDAGSTETGRLYFVMEHVPGLPITEYCDRHRLSIRERLELFLPVCRAVQHAHQKGVIHRDLKPSNVMVAVEDDKPVPKVIDFGVAKAINQRLTEQTVYTALGNLVGTPEYMSPEQAEMSGLGVDTTTDIYSLGVMLYEILTGVLPFDSKTLRQAGLDEMHRIIREVEPPRPSTRLSGLGTNLSEVAGRRHADPSALRQSVRGELDWITMRAMEKNRTRRYPSASELATDIERHLRQEAVMAGPPSGTYRIKKFLLRHRGAATAVGAVFVALALGLAVSLMMYFNAASARKQARWQSYIGNIRAAEAAVRSNASAEAKDVLARCPEEYRNWEWKFLNSRADASMEVKALPYSENYPMWVAFDARNHCICARWWAESTDLAALQIYDLTNGSTIDTLKAADLGYLGLPGVPPEADGFFLSAIDPRCGMMITAAAGSVDAREYPSGRLVRRLPASPSFCLCLETAENGGRVAAAFVDGSIWMWELPSGRQLASRRCDGAAITNLAFLPGGLAFRCDDDRVGILDPSKQDGIRYLSPAERDPQNSQYTAGFHLAASNDGTLLAGVAGANIHVWDTVSGELLGTLRGHERRVNGIQFSPDDRRLVSTSADRTVRVWNTLTLDPMSTLRGHEDDISGTIAFEPGGDRFWTFDLAGFSRIWRAKDDRPAVLLPFHGRKLAYPITIEPGGRHIASIHPGGVDIWDVPFSLEPFRLNWPQDTVHVAKYGGAGGLLFAGSSRGALRIWDSRSRSLRSTWTVHNGPVASLAVNPDGSRVLTADGPVLDNQYYARENTGIRCWDSSNGAMLFDLGPHDQESYTAVPICFSPDGRAIATGGWEVRIWDSGTGRLRRSLGRRASEEGGCRQLGFSPDGRGLLEVTSKGTIRLWDPRTGKLKVKTRGEPQRFEPKFLPDGSRAFFIAGSGIRLWDPASGDAIVTLSGIGKIPLGMLPGEELITNDGTWIDVARPSTAPSGFEGDHSSCLNSAGYDLVDSPGRTVGTYLLGLRSAQEASRMNPQSPHILHTLGVARYRLGRYREAADTFSECERLWKALPDESRPVPDWILASIAAANAQLGNRTQAREAYDRLVRDPAFKEFNALPDANATVTEFLATTERILGIEPRAAGSR